MTRSHISLAVLAIAGFATTAAAVAPEKGAVLGTDAVAIGTALAEDGFELIRYKRAPALIQIAARKDGRKHVILISPRDGTVISHKSAAPVASPVSPVLPENIEQRLAAEGYDLRRVKTEGFEIEVYAMRDGQLWELKLDPATGDILHIEAED